MNDPIIFTSEEEFQARPNYRKKLQCEKDDLKEIIGIYIFGKEINCNLMSCTKRHKKGYVVVLKDGRETNCGHLCGKREFGGIEFSGAVRGFKEKVRRQQLRESLERLFSELGEHEKKLLALESIASKNKDLIDKINSILAKDKTAQTAVLNSEGKVVYERIATEKEKKNLLHLKDGQYISEVIGVVRDLDSLGMSFPIRDALRAARITINELKELDPKNIKAKDMEKYSLKSNDINRSLLSLADFNEKSERFFSEQNINEFMKFQKILTQNRAKRIFNQIKSAVDEHKTGQ